MPGNSITCLMPLQCFEYTNEGAPSITGVPSFDISFLLSIPLNSSCRQELSSSTCRARQSSTEPQDWELEDQASSRLPLQPWP